MPLLDTKRSVKLSGILYTMLKAEAKKMKRTFTGHLEDIVEKHFKTNNKRGAQ